MARTRIVIALFLGILVTVPSAAQQSERCRVWAKMDEPCTDSEPATPKAPPAVRRPNQQTSPQTIGNQAPDWVNSLQRKPFRGAGARLRFARAVDGSRNNIQFFSDGRLLSRSALRLGNFQQVDQVVTGPNQTVELLLSNGHRLTVGPNTDIKIDEINLQDEFSLYTRITKGWYRIWSSITERRGRFELRVSDTVFVGVRGTDFKVGRDETGNIEVSLSDGYIELFDSGRNTLVPIRAGQTRIIQLTPYHRLTQIADDACDCRTSACGHQVFGRFIRFGRDLKPSSWKGNHKAWSDTSFRVGQCLVQSGVDSGYIQSRLRAELM